MDAYKRLRIEFGNIEKTITDYTSSGAANFLSELKASVENCDKDAILYCLDSMIAWYESHIREIHSNEFVFNSDEHDQVFATLKEVRAGLENYNFIPTNNLPRENNSPMIFLSHRSADKNMLMQ